MLEFVPSWTYEDDLKSYLETCFATIQANIVNDEENGSSNSSKIWKISKVAYCNAQRWYNCPCALPKESHDAWLNHGFCVTHLEEFDDFNDIENMDDFDNIVF